MLRYDEAHTLFTAYPQHCLLQISSNPSMEDTLSEHLSRQNSTDHDEFPQLSSKGRTSRL